MSVKRLQIFRAGRHTALDGQSYDFTEQQLRDAVAAYDPAAKEAPLVVGHPRLDDPAYGWVRGLQYSSDGVVEAEPHQVDAAFAEIVNAGRYKYISASWYLPDSPSNPKPGSLYLRHVGFLGAQPPAVKGLKSASFAADEAGVIEFGDWADSRNASMWRRMREWIIEKFSREEADKVIPDWDITALEDAARSTDKTPSYSEPTQELSVNPEEMRRKEQELQRREAAIQQREAAFSEREQTISTQERAQQLAAHVSFADGLIAAGKLLPAHKAGVVALISTLAPTGVVEFAEGDKTVKTPAVEWFKTFLGAQPKLVVFGEHDRDAPTDASDASAIAQRAVEFRESERKAGREISVTTAVQHITRGAGR